MTDPEYARHPAGTYLVRVHRLEHDPLFFGPDADNPPRHRFDAPGGEYGICYLAVEPRGAFVESFLRDPNAAGTRAPRILAASELQEHGLSYITVRTSLTVARLQGTGLSWRGVTASISAVPRYKETRKLALQVYREDAQPEGLQYRSRHDNDEVAVALFDRAEEALDVDEGSTRNCLAIARELQDLYPFVVDEGI